MREVTAYVHTHWDREWYRSFEEFRLRLIEVMDRVLEALEKNSLSSFYFDGQTAALEDYLQIRPEKENIIKSFVKEKKLRIGPFYCASDSLLVSAASLEKNLETGIKTARKFGETDFIAYISDSFGHSGDIPRLLKSFNIDKACVWRGLGDCAADLDFEGIKTVNLVQGYFQDFLHSNLSIDKKAENLKKYLDKIAAKSGENILLPIGADHLAALENITETIDALNEIYTDYHITLGSPFDYFKKITKYEKIKGEFLDNSRTFLLKGVYSARPDIKRANAAAQRLLIKIAEPLNKAASSRFGALNKTSEINYAYKELIKNHAHDSIYGCIIDEAAQDIMTRYRAVNTIADGIIKRTLRDIEDENGAFSVINLSKHPYSGKVFFETEKELPEYLKAVKISKRRGFTDKKLYNIFDIPVTEDFTDIYTCVIDVKELPPFSLTKITPDKVYIKSSIKADKNSIENDYIKIEISNIITVTDKKTGAAYKDFIRMQDRKDAGDSYNFGAVKGDKPVYSRIKSFKLKEKNNIRAVLQVLFEIDKHKISFDFILYNQSRMIEVQAEWINKKKNHLLQIGFNLKNKITKTLSGDLYTAAERHFDPDYDIYKHIPAARGIELKTNTAPFQKFVNAENLTLISEGIYEYEVNKNTLYLTLLRAIGIISNPENPVRGTPAGPPLETPSMQQLGKNSARFAFAFTDNKEEMRTLADEFDNLNVCLYTALEDFLYRSD